jgi:hypothetical protein
VTIYQLRLMIACFDGKCEGTFATGV